MIAVALLGDSNSMVFRPLMPVPRSDGYFHNREQNAESCQKPLGALPVLLVLLQAALQVSDASAVSIPYQAAHLGL
jgi:hypothetical protein